MKKMSTKMIVEAGIMIALSQILSYVKFVPMPNGGTVTLGSMIPIMIFALRYGVLAGCFVGAVYGIFQLILGDIGFLTAFVSKKSYFKVFFVLMLNYILAFGSLGLAGLFFNKIKNNIIGAITGVFSACFLRFIFHFISGVTIWKEYAGEQNVYLYSMAYNLTYMLPEAIISVLIISILIKPLKKFL